jgi:hypothetical protein
MRRPFIFIDSSFRLHSLKIDINIEIFVVVMGNQLNTRLKIHERYDLKGSWVARSSKGMCQNIFLLGDLFLLGHRKDPGNVLGKDEDLQRKIRLDRDTRAKLLAQLERDAMVIFFGNFHGVHLTLILVSCKQEHNGL